jgi:hypothetical protein
VPDKSGENRPVFRGIRARFSHVAAEVTTSWDGAG